MNIYFIKRVFSLAIYKKPPQLKWYELNWDESIVICPHCYTVNLFKIEIYGTDKLKEIKDRCVKCHKVL